MRFRLRPLRPAIVFVCLALATPLFAAEKPRIQVDDYVIDAELIPRTHRLIARAKVKFTALDDISVATFELHNALRPTKVLDARGQPLSAERVVQESSIRVPLPNGLAKGASTTLTFDYEGTLQTADDSPVQGLKLAYIGDGTSYLLYAGRWFPVVGYGTNRFTATIRVTVPADLTVIGTGAETAASGVSAPAETPAAPPPLRRGRRRTATPQKPAESTAPPRGGLSGPVKTYTFIWNKPAFPGTIIAGKFDQSTSTEGGIDLKVLFTPSHKDVMGTYTETAGKEFQYFSTLWGPPLSHKLTVVELPEDTVPMTWSTEIVGLSSHAISNKVNYRLLANAIAHQWWGSSVSPADKDNWWLADGFSRFGEARYVEQAAGPTAYEEVTKDMSVGALAYDTVPLAQIGRLDTFSPEFQALTTDKGAVILSMLRWVVGDQVFEKSMNQFASQFAGKPATVDDFRQVVEQNFGDKLTWFFTQWLNSTGAPEFKTKYTVFRLGKGACSDPTKCKGFRIVGEVSQDLDLFRMPVEVKVDTDGKSEEQRIEVVGTNSAFTIETFGRPRRITIDPDNHVLKNASDVKVRAAILRGQGLVQQGDLAQALEQFQEALKYNKNSSLAHYRIADVFFLQHNYQAAANAYRESLSGDGEPRWTEVWSHIQLGKIFDITGQRERATNEYRQALQTQDDTQGALGEARKYLSSPYDPSKEAKSGD